MKRGHISPLIIPSIVLALGGIADSLYLLIKHYTYSSVTCNLVEGCESVLVSQYATLFGLPVSLIGLVYYAAVLVTLLSIFIVNPRFISRIFFAITSFGFIFSVHFVYLQLRVIGEICQYCMASALITFLLFIFGIFIFRRVSVIFSKPDSDTANFL